MSPPGFTYGGAPTPQYQNYQASANQADVINRYGMANASSPSINSPIYPEHLQGCVPVSLGKRVLARLLDGAIAGFLGAVLYLLLSTMSSTVAGMDFEYALNLSVGLASLPLLIYYLFTGWWPGARVLGVRSVRYDQPLAPKVKGFVKEVLNGLSGLFLGIPRLIIALATRDELGRHAVDRLCAMIVLDVAKGRDPLNTSDFLAPTKGQQL